MPPFPAAPPRPPATRLCPFAVLNLPTFEEGGFTEEQLRYNYKILARQLHPDKRPRDMTQQQATTTFQVLTEAYRTLAQELENRRADRTFLELRSPYSASRENRPEPPTRSPPEKKKFDLQRFNAVFDENRVPDPVVDNGYGKWMQENAADAQKQLATRAKPWEPQPTAIVNSGRSLVQYSELGAGTVDDYSRGDAGRHVIQYTDYRLAHTTSELATEEELRVASRREAELSRYSNPAAVQKMRASALATEMTADEAHAIASARSEAERIDRERQATLRAYDRLIGAVHERTSRMLIGSA